MKKTLFTICSVLTVCAIIVMSCEKSEDPDMKKVYYNTQPGYSTGGNPNPTGAATSGGSATTTTGGTSSSGTATSSTTTGSSCTSAMSIGAATCNTVSAVGGVATTYRIIHSSSCTQIQITFSTGTAPASGTYAIVPSAPAAGQCTVADIPSSVFATGGSVVITTGSPNKAVYSNVTIGALTASGTACY